MKRDKKGYIHVDGERFDEWLRVLQKYYKTGDVDILHYLHDTKEECFGKYNDMCADVIGSYVCRGNHYTSHSKARILSLASFCGVKVDYE